MVDCNFRLCTQTCFLSLLLIWTALGPLSITQLILARKIEITECIVVDEPVKDKDIDCLFTYNVTVDEDTVKDKIKIIDHRCHAGLEKSDRVTCSHELDVKKSVRLGYPWYANRQLSIASIFVMLVFIPVLFGCCWLVRDCTLFLNGASSCIMPCVMQAMSSSRFKCLPFFSDTLEESEQKEIVLCELDTKEIPCDWRCAICLEEHSDLQDTQAVTKLMCAHIYHSACIFAWKSRGNHSCPLCRNIEREETVWRCSHHGELRCI